MEVEAMHARWFACGLLVVASMFARVAGADDPGHFRLADALDATDRRIETASSLLAGASSAPTQAASELATARKLQDRARASAAADQPVIAYRTTLDARAHADRCVALVRGLPDPDRVTAQVNRTRDILDRARDRLQTCEDLRARALLKVALDMQERAEHRLDQSMYLGALQLTMSARERVQKAMQLCNVNESLADTADRALQRTNEVLTRTSDAVQPDSPQARRDMLARAQSIQAQAHGEARAEHYESALRLTQDARAIALRALRYGRAVRGRAR
jgi:hypothetical protein